MVFWYLIGDDGLKETRNFGKNLFFLE